MRQSLNPFLCLGLVLVLATSCVQRGSQRGGQQPPLNQQPAQPVVTAAPGGTLRLPLSISIDDPVVKNLGFSDPRLFALARCLEMPLLRALPDGTLAPGLARSAEVQEDGKAWDFPLRTALGGEREPNALGEHLIQRYREILRGSDSPLKAQLADLVAGAADYRDGKAMEVSGLRVDKGTLHISLTRQDQYFALWTSQPGLGVMLNRDYSRFPAAGFGPFGLTAVEGNELVLKPNPDALDGKPLLDELRFVCEPDAKKQLDLYRTGKLDAANVGWADVATVNADAALKTAVVEQATCAMYLGLFDHHEFPWGDQSFQSKRGLRAGMNQGLDVAQLADTCGGLFKPWRHFLPPAFSDSLPPALVQQPVFPLSNDLEAAKASLKSADHEQGSHLIPGMDLGYRRGLVEPQLVIEVLRYWNEISVRMRPFPLTADEQALRVSNGRQEILLVRHCPAYPDVDAALYPLLHSALYGNGGNLLMLKDSAIDKALADGQATGDKVLRQKVYQALTQRLEENAMAVFLGNSTPTLLISPRIAGLALTPYDFDASLPAQDFAKLGLAAK